MEHSAFGRAAPRSPRAFKPGSRNAARMPSRITRRAIALPAADFAPRQGPPPGNGSDTCRCGHTQEQHAVVTCGRHRTVEECHAKDCDCTSFVPIVGDPDDSGGL